LIKNGIDYFNKLKTNEVIRNIIIVAGLSLFIKVVAFGKESLVASYFGLSLLLDTYFIAILIPSFIQNVFIGALKNLFIPNYITELRTTNQKGSFQTITFLAITALVVSLGLFCIVFVEFFLEMVFPNHDGEYYDLVRLQFYCVLPTLLFWGYSGFLSGLLEIQKKYFIATLSDIILPITTIAIILLFKDTFPKTVLAIGLSVGSVLGFLYLLYAAIYNKVLELGKPIINSNIRIMFRQYLPKTTSGLLTGINPFVDQFFAAQLVVGSIAAMNYGIKIPSFFLGILILAIGNVLLPHFSELIIENLRKAFLQLFKTLKIVLIGSTMIAVIVILFSNDIIRILFERNEFSANDTYVVSNIQKLVLISLPFNLATLICVKFLTAFNKNAFMAWVSFFNLFLNLILNFILVNTLKVYGLVLATTIVYFITFFIYITYIHNLFKRTKDNT
jgi:putative peptidoglycan lipid II flippase